MTDTYLSLDPITAPIVGGYKEAALVKAEGKQIEMSAKAEQLKGREQADKIRQSLLSTLASQNAAFAARGISIRSGTPANIANMSRIEASKDLGASRFNSGMQSEGLRMSALQRKGISRSLIMKGYAQSIETATKIIAAAAGGG